MEKANLNSLRAIRIVKDMKTDDFANAFGVTKSYICALEKNEKNIKIQTLKYGLDNLGISLDDYNELEEYGKLLSTYNIDEKKKFALFLIKAISVSTKELSEQADFILSNQVIDENEINNKILYLQEQIQYYKEQLKIKTKEK